MRDKEIAQQIAEELNRLRNRVDTLEILMAGYRVVGRNQEELPWRKDLADMQEVNVEYQALMRERDEQLRQLLDGEEFESSPFQAVWKTYCQRRSR